MELPHLDHCRDAADACAALAQRGWQACGQGDWSWVFADPSGRIAARITPWDPAYLLHAYLCAANVGNPYLQRIHRIDALGEVGHIVYMERLYVADAASATALSTALQADSDTVSPEVAALRARLREVVIDGARSFPFWGGSDISPKNILADAAGKLKVIDSVFVSGRAIVKALVDGDHAALRHLRREELRAFLTIPVFAAGAETDALMAAAEAVYAARAS